MNIILIGMPASGKSTVGVLLAKRMALDFVDTDLILQMWSNRTLHSLLMAHGPEALKRLEERVILERLELHRGTVVATGGSVVYSEKAMIRLQSMGIVLYLQVGYETLAARIVNLDQRGVIRTEGQSLHDLYRERAPLYESWARASVSATGDPDRVVQRIVHWIRKNNGM